MSKKNLKNTGTGYPLFPTVVTRCKTMLKRRSFQEIDGQLESERKYVERLAVEDFGTTHVGKVSDDEDNDDYCDDYDADDDHTTMIKSQNFRLIPLIILLQARKYLWNLTEYPETSVWARVSRYLDHHDTNYHHNHHRHHHHHHHHHHNHHHHRHI